MTTETQTIIPMLKEEKPHVLLENTDLAHAHIAVPPGWTVKDVDQEKLLRVPRRKVARVSCADTDSFIGYVQRHGQNMDIGSIWCDADYVAGRVSFMAILNDHGAGNFHPNWRDHTARYAPEFSVEWSRWTNKNKVQFSQSDFAALLEENGKDIAGVDGMPSGALMLEMALNMEANQDVRFKSAIRLQNGGVQLSFVQDDDAQTLARMQLFEKFAIGIPVFRNGPAYQISARLRYRVRDGKLTFWYELIRVDAILEAAATELIATVREKTGLQFYFGTPGV